MAHFLSNVTDQGATPGLVRTMAFEQARLRMVAENVANYGTPHYRTKQLNEQAFRAALGEAYAERRKQPVQSLDVEVQEEVKVGDDGLLVVTPQETPEENALHYDGTNMSIEEQMAQLADAGMMHRLASELLKNRFDGLRRAITGRAG